MNIRSVCKLALAAAFTATLVFAQPKPKSQKEVDAIMAIQNATTPDACISAVENLVTKFADTEFKSMALLMAADCSQRKGDFEKMVVYAERTLEADPKNFQAMLMLAGGIAQRTREFDLDKEDKLTRADKLAHQAMDALKTAAKPNPQIPDQQWETMKKDANAQGHEVLGQVALVRKKYDVAVQEYKTALESAGTPEPATYVRLAGAYNQSNKPDEAIAVLDKLNSLTEVHPQIKTAANTERNNAMKLKGGGAAKPAGTPSATPSAAPAATPGAATPGASTPAPTPSPK